MLDGDIAGVKATHRIEMKLRKIAKSRVHPIYLSLGADPDDLSDDALREKVNQFFF